MELHRHQRQTRIAFLFLDLGFLCEFSVGLARRVFLYVHECIKIVNRLSQVVSSCRAPVLVIAALYNTVQYNAVQYETLSIVISSIVKSCQRHSFVSHLHRLCLSQELVRFCTFRMLHTECAPRQWTDWCGALHVDVNVTTQRTKTTYLGSRIRVDAGTNSEIQFSVCRESPSCKIDARGWGPIYSIW